MHSETKEQAASRNNRTAASIIVRHKVKEQRPIPAINITGVYAGLGDVDKAFEWLERAYEERNSALTSLKVNSALDNLRSDPRFNHLLERVGLTQTGPR